MIVDDNPGVLASAGALLERGGIQVVALATNTAEAVAAFAAHAPDVVLVDIDLGGESGFDLARRLDSTARVILISTHAERDFAELIEESPAIGFLSKSALSAPAVECLLNAHPGM
jgi:DNA-binding NarL/FixJ family response regulator